MRDASRALSALRARATTVGETLHALPALSILMTTTARTPRGRLLRDLARPAAEDALASWRSLGHPASASRRRRERRSKASLGVLDPRRERELAVLRAADATGSGELRGRVPDLLASAAGLDDDAIATAVAVDLGARMGFLSASGDRDRLAAAVAGRDLRGVRGRVASLGQDRVANPGGLAWDALLAIDAMYSLAELDGSVLDGRAVVLDLAADWRLAQVLKAANPDVTYMATGSPAARRACRRLLLRFMPGEATAAQSIVGAEPLSADSLRDGSIRLLEPCQMVGLVDRSVDVVVGLGVSRLFSASQLAARFEIVGRIGRSLYLQDAARWLEQPSSSRAGIAASLGDSWRGTFLRPAAASGDLLEAGFTACEGSRGGEEA